jgi:RNA polymerase primary sigma factor
MAASSAKSKASKQTTKDAVPPARIPAWLKSEELSAASVTVRDEYRARTEPIDQLAADGLDRLVRASMKRELSFITNPEFDVAGIGEQIFSETLGLSTPADASDSKSRSALADLPVHLGRMCEAPLLTPKQ